MRYGSVCSGVEAATVAWHPLGWKPRWFSEIEKFPSAVLAHHYPDVPNHGDMTTFKEWPDDPIDLLVGGTPCQSFSIAGLRKGLDDPRGNLMLTYLAIAARYKPRWVAWENVPGVLSSNRGRDFGTFLGALGELGYGFAYRVLDAQYFGVAQRRRRVFVVGYLGDWRRAAAVLFERESLSGHPAPRREARKSIAGGFECGPQGGGFTDVAPTLDTRCKQGPIRNQLGAGVFCADVALTLNAAFGSKLGLEDQHINGGGACSLPPVSMCLNAGGMGRQDAETETLIPTRGGGFDVAHALRGEGFDASEDGTGRGTPLVPVAIQDCSPTLRAGGHAESHANAGVPPAVTVALRGARRWSDCRDWRGSRNCAARLFKVGVISRMCSRLWRCAA
jgi:DNA (cytosine-5)-methyltransferase 1